MVEDDDEVFSEKTQRLIAQLARQMAKVAQLDPVIRAKLAGLRSALDVREFGHEHSRS